MHHFVVRFALCAIACVFLPEAHATDLYAALGDSITEAVRANTELRGYADPVLEDAGLKPRTTEHRPSQRELEEMYSWASGNKILSQYLFLKNFAWVGFVGPMDVLNVAKGGKRAVDMEEQATHVVDAMKTKEYRFLAYVTMLVGANDVCSPQTPEGTPNDQFRIALDKVFSKLATISQKEPIRILVMGIPNVPLLGKEEINNARVASGVSCKTIRKLLNACQQILNWNTPDEYQQKVNVVRAKNAVLKESVESANEKFKNLDVVFSDRLFRTAPAIGDLAADCFHPNVRGQQKISSAAWAEQPWFW